MTIRLVTCVGSHLDRPMLPHFLRHYTALGIDPANMHVILQATAEGDALDQARAILRNAGTAPPEVWIAPYTSDTMWAKRREIQAKHAGAADWVVHADVDELHQYPTGLAQLLAWCDARGINCMQGPFIDRVAADGTLPEIVPSPVIEEQFPLEAEVICAIRGGAREPGFKWGTVKVMATKGGLLLNRGGHHPRDGDVKPVYLCGQALGDFLGVTRPAFRFAFPLHVHHYKWVATLLEGTRTRLATPGVSPAGKDYSEQLTLYIARHGGIPLGQVAIRKPAPWDRVPWQAKAGALQALARAETIGKRSKRWIKRAIGR